MDLARPHRSVGMGATGDILVALAALRAPLSGRRIAARAGVSPSQTSKVLMALADAGLVDATAARPAILYQLNREHVLAPVVDAAVAAKAEWQRRLRTMVQSWTLRPAAVALFGSAATGTASARSDIDVLVVRPDGTQADDEVWSSQLSDLARGIARWTGNDVDIVDSTRGELIANQRLLTTVRTDGSFVVGDLPAVVRSHDR